MRDGTLMIIGGIVGAIGLPYAIYFRGTTKAARPKFDTPAEFTGIALAAWIGAAFGALAGLILDIVCHGGHVKL
jgi:hypothetical protein